jgi:NADPH:quinone reductase
VRAIVLNAARTAEVVERPPPEPGPGEVRIALEGSGVCGSDLPAWQGRPWFSYPLAAGAPGHEGWGRVAAVGPGVEGLEPEARVTGLSYHAYAEADMARAEHLVRLPATLDGRPFPGEPLGCAVNVFRRARITVGQRVAVVGIGFLGAIVIQLAVAAGAFVVGVSRRQSARDQARALGAAETSSLQAPPEPESFDVAIEAAGRQDTLDVASALVRTRGRLVIAGFHQDGARQIDLQSWNWRGLDVINAHERDPTVYLEGIRLAVGWTVDGRLDPDPLYTHRFAIGSLGDALETAARRPSGFMKTLVLT